MDKLHFICPYLKLSKLNCCSLVQVTLSSSFHLVAFFSLYNITDDVCMHAARPCGRRLGDVMAVVEGWMDGCVTNKKFWYKKLFLLFLSQCDKRLHFSLSACTIFSLQSLILSCNLLFNFERTKFGFYHVLCFDWMISKICKRHSFPRFLSVIILICFQHL